MKHSVLKRTLAAILAVLLMLAMTGCFSSYPEYSYSRPSYTGPTYRVPGQENTFPQVTRPGTTPTDATQATQGGGSDTVKIYASVPDHWTKPYCWASGTQGNVFSQQPGAPMTKYGDWYEILVPNWVNRLVISNNGNEKTVEKPVIKGRDVWVVVETDKVSYVYYTEPELPDRPTTPEVKPDDKPQNKTTLQHKDLSYVMIYNPFVYDEYNAAQKGTLRTGYLGTQIDVDAYRGSGLEEELDIGSVSQGEIMEGLDLGIFEEGGRGNGLGKDYKVGDTKRFYCTTAGNSNCNIRSQRNMTCMYAGKYCYVWNDGSMTKAQLQMYGKEFDEKVYQTMITTFGMPRFVGASGKVNLLFYPIAGNTGGYFHPYDLYGSDEVTSRDITQYGMNTDHAIVHFNSNYAGNSRYELWMKGTMAHEFQHLLCYTAYFTNYVCCRTWLNEAMSGYIEQQIFPGGKAQGGQLASINTSDRIRKGQSLYNFTNNSSDIGVYGSVYYFSEYLAAYGGKDVFSKIHSYWRTSYSKTLCEAEAIYMSVPTDYRNGIDEYLNYSSKIKFVNSYEEWMSKMTLHFYLTMFAKTGNLPNYDQIKVASLLYNDMQGARIEGGGRIVLATKGDTFQIPDDADTGLVYIGLDKNFQIVDSYVP